MKTNRDVKKILRRARAKRKKNRRVYDETLNEINGWPEWKKRAALCNYVFGKEDAE